MLKFLSYLESVISGERKGIFPVLLKFLLLLVSWVALIAVKLRRYLYSKGIISSECLPCKVISIGNIVAGGGGKTPAVIAIARMLERHTDLSIAILSRGYHSEGSKADSVVSDGSKMLLDTVAAGDEPYLIGKSLPKIPVLIGKDRIQTGLIAIRKWKSQVVILDDGFQYLKLARDVNIAAVDATRPFGLNHILPRGYLREPLSAFNYANLILLTRVDQCKCLNSLRSELARIAPSVPVFESIHRPRSLRSLNTEQELKLDVLRNKNILAVCGIANPLSFAETLRSLGPTQVELLSFPDHYLYPPHSLEQIRQKAADLDVDLIVTTEKDAPKLNHIIEKQILSLIIELELVNSTTEEFLHLLI